MMIAVVGSNLYVRGSRSATPAREPMPGIAPTIRPRIDPRRQAPRFWSENTTPKP